MTFIEVSSVHVVFESGGRAVQALAGIDLAVEEGAFVALLGPTGCGKSTLLRLVGDLEPATSGRITVAGRPAAEARRANRFGFVFQDAALMPWRTALGNVQLPLEVLRSDPAERRGRCEQLLDMVGLLPFRDAYPDQLSGGMKQRTAIVRALAWNPPILLMDEPFSALDELTRDQLQEDLLRLWAKERKTVLFVTHNIAEAVYLADRVIVMTAHPGRIAAEIPIELGRPRAADIRDTVDFLDHVRRCRTALRH